MLEAENVFRLPYSFLIPSVIHSGLYLDRWDTVLKYTAAPPPD